MDKKKLNYRFHNPNTDKDMERYIEKILIDNGVSQLFTSVKEMQETNDKIEKVL